MSIELTSIDDLPEEPGEYVGPEGEGYDPEEDDTPGTAFDSLKAPAPLAEEEATTEEDAPADPVEPPVVEETKKDDADAEKPAEVAAVAEPEKVAVEPADDPEYWKAQVAEAKTLVTQAETAAVEAARVLAEFEASFEMRDEDGALIDTRSMTPAESREHYALMRAAEKATDAKADAAKASAEKLDDLLVRRVVANDPEYFNGSVQHVREIAKLGLAHAPVNLLKAMVAELGGKTAPAATPTKGATDTKPRDENGRFKTPDPKEVEVQALTQRMAARGSASMSAGRDGGGSRDEKKAEQDPKANWTDAQRRFYASSVSNRD